MSNDGTDANVGGTIQSYGRNQDVVGTDPQVVLSGDTATLLGNAWKAFVLPSQYTLTENTAVQFTLMIKNSDSPDDGVATMSNIRLYDDTRNRPILKLTVDGQEVETASRGEPYRINSDLRGLANRRYAVAADGLGVTFFGNVIKSFPMTARELREDIFLEFDFLMETAAKVHAICLDDNLTSNRVLCFHLGGQYDFHRFDFTYGVHDTAIETLTRRFQIELNHFFDAISFEINMVAFSNNNGDSVLGEATFSNIRIYDQAKNVRPPKCAWRYKKSILRCAAAIMAMRIVSARI